MTVVTFARIREDANWPINCALLHDVIWALATSDAGLENVRVSGRKEKLDVALFCTAWTAEDARSKSIALCQNVCAVSPLLRGWGISG
jgi:hypothetical protein